MTPVYRVPDGYNPLVRLPNRFFHFPILPAYPSNTQRLYKIQISHYLTRDYTIYKFLSTYPEMMQYTDLSLLSRDYPIYRFLTTYAEIIQYTDLLLLMQRLYKIQISHCQSRDYTIYRFITTYQEIIQYTDLSLPILRLYNIQIFHDQTWMLAHATFCTC